LLGVSLKISLCLRVGNRGLMRMNWHAFVAEATIQFVVKIIIKKG
jgi:hypothetical protein